MSKKYIIIEQGGAEMPIIFPGSMYHRDVYRDGMKVISAGTLNIWTTIEDKVQAGASGESLSLKVKSRPEDSDIITNWLNAEGY